MASLCRACEASKQARAPGFLARSGRCYPRSRLQLPMTGFVTWQPPWSATNVAGTDCTFYSKTVKSREKKLRTPGLYLGSVLNGPYSHLGVQTACRIPLRTRPVHTAFDPVAAHSAGLFTTPVAPYYDFDSGDYVVIVVANVVHLVHGITSNSKRSRHGSARSGPAHKYALAYARISHQRAHPIVSGNTSI